jgi:hypothetical protein
MLKPRSTRLLLACVAILAGAVATSGASASPPTEASGTVGNTSATFISVRPSGHNLIVEVSGTVAYTGTFTGTSRLSGLLIIHADGSANFHDVEVFTGTVNGVPGTVTFNLNGSNNASLAVHATNTIVDATGDLAGLHGVLHLVQTVVFPVGPVGTYSGQIQFGEP